MTQVIHFDINGTITCHDSTELGTATENANLLIAKNVHGTFSDHWVLKKDYFNRTDAVSYYDYLKLIHKDYKSYAYKITLEYPALAYLVPKIMATPFLFPSFIKTIEKYPEAKIVFRTFGNDADELIIHLKRHFPERFDIVNKGTMSYNLGIPNLKVNGCVLTSMDDINNTLEYCLPIIIKEDYNYWNQNGRDATHGKCIKGCDFLQQIFFDDNNCVNVIDSQNAKFIRVNPLEALLDEDYFNKYIL